MKPLLLTDDEREHLQGMARSRSMPYSLVVRAQIILACSNGEANKDIAERLGLSGMTVDKWRKRFLDQGITGLHDELRPGRPRSYKDEKVAEVINFVLQTKPDDGSPHWSTRTVAKETGASKTTVHRWLQAFSVKSHLQETFKLSTDPFFC